MPNRILKESICTSGKISKCTWFDEVLFYRLIVNCDDYGRFDGRIPIIKNRLFPLSESLTNKNVSDAVNRLVKIGLVSCYEADGKPFLFLPTWDDNQTIRAKKSKYPEPEIICNQMQADESKCIRNPIQSESNPNQNPNICAEPESASTQNAILLPLNDGTDFGVTEEMVSEFVGLYPAVDVMQELRNMRGWLLNNQKNRKTRSGIRRFINAWLSKAQDKPKARQQQYTHGSDRLADMVRRGDFDD